jgi:hypothetical protein
MERSSLIYTFCEEVALPQNPHADQRLQALSKPRQNGATFQKRTVLRVEADMLSVLLITEQITEPHKPMNPAAGQITELQPMTASKRTIRETSPPPSRILVCNREPPT